MTVQTIELNGRRYVIVPEQEFDALRRQAAKAEAKQPFEQELTRRFEPVTPLVVSGESASEMLIRERR